MTQYRTSGALARETKRTDQRLRAAILGIVAAPLVILVAGLVVSHGDSRLGNRLGQAIGSFRTIAEMLADRSPGKRAEGMLISLKPPRRPAIHERALAKVRKPIPAILQGPLDGVAAPSSGPQALPINPGSAPIYQIVSGGAPPAGLPLDRVPGGGPIGIGGPGTPTLLPASPSGPTGLLASPVPEPASWTMYLLGFALVGASLRSSRSGHKLRGEGLPKAVERSWI